MGVKNYLIDGVSCAGKTTVCGEGQRVGGRSKPCGNLLLRRCPECRPLPAHAVIVDATAPIASVVDTILGHVHQV